jgi:hypothetical protein
MDKLFCFLCSLVLASIFFFSLSHPLWPAPGPADSSKPPRSASSQPSIERERPAGEVHSLIQEIQTLNLVNSLYLRKEQMSSLVQLAEDTERARAAFDRSLKDLDEENVKVLRVVRDELSRGETLSLETTRMLQGLEERVQRGRYGYEIQRSELLKKAHDVLSENQQLLVARYQPCIAPSHSTTNPERVGQADSGEFIEKILTDARKVPDAEFPAFRKRFLDHAQKMIFLHEGEERAARKVQEIDRILTQVRTMKDEDFELSKAKLAGKIGPPQSEANADSRLASEMIERFLLSRESLKVLKKKLLSARE